MTLPSSGIMTIAMIKAEFASRGAYNDLNSWGQVVLGRPSGQAVYMSEFYGRSNIVETAYGPCTQLAPNADGNVYQYVATAWGNIYTSWGQVADGRTTYGIDFSLGVGSTAWPYFVRVQHPSGNILKAAFSPSGSWMYAITGPPPHAAGPFYWVFNV